MLTSDVVRATVRGRAVLPTFVDPDRPELVETAGRLVQAAARAAEEGWTRGDLEEALAAETDGLRGVRLGKGLAKLVLDRCEDAVDAPLPPVELRARVFRAARDAGPLALAPDSLGRPTADDVLAAVGAELGIDADAVGRALYADLPDARVVRAFEPLSAGALLHRYNVALVQALLLRAFEVKVTLGRPTTDRVRQLLRHARFHQLLFRAEHDADALVLTLDGPASILERSTRYGLALAAFFPAVLLQDAPWSVEAEVAWGPTAARRDLRVDHTHGLRSHLSDTGAWAPRERAWFLERWQAKGAGSGWQIGDDPQPIALGVRGVLLPDFTFTKDGRTAHLEIVGTWRRAWLEARLDALRVHGAGNVVLAVSRKLAARAGEALDGLPVVTFAEVVPVDDVLAALDRVAS